MIEYGAFFAYSIGLLVVGYTAFYFTLRKRLGKRGWTYLEGNRWIKDGVILDLSSDQGFQ